MLQNRFQSGYGFGLLALPATGGGASGGHASVAGSAGTGGTATLPPVTFKCAGKLPNQPVITSFDGFMAATWMSPGNLDGGA